VIISTRYNIEQNNRSGIRIMMHLSLKRLKKIKLKRIYPTGKICAIKFKEELYDDGFTCSAKTEQVPTIHVEKTEPMPICTKTKEDI
jgi:hypothetical protein